MAVLAFVALIVDITGRDNEPPVLIQLSLLISEATIENPINAINDILMVFMALYFVLAITPFFLGRCFYYSASVTRARSIARFLMFNFLSFAAVVSLSTVLAVVYLSDNIIAMILAILLHIVWALCTLTLIYKTQ
jgi:hypothetical protein